MMIQRIAEVIESNSSFNILASEYLKSQQKAELGELIKIQSAPYTLYAVIANVENTSLDTNRNPTPMGLSKEEISKEMSHIFQLVYLKYTAIIIGYETGGVLHQGIPPISSDLHDFGFQTTEDEQNMFFEKEVLFVPLLLQSKSITSAQEVLISCLNKYSKIISHQSLIRIGKEISFLMQKDMHQLENMLRRIFFA